MLDRARIAGNASAGGAPTLQGGMPAALDTVVTRIHDAVK
jgi:hypothetical protein